MNLERAFLYIDDRRINAYYEQMYLALAEQASVAAFFQLWPEQVHAMLHTKELQPALPFASPYEKVSSVVQHLRKSNQYTPKRGHPLNNGRDFVYYEVSLRAQRVPISDKVCLWISENPCDTQEYTGTAAKHGHLILVEGYSQKDTDVKFYGGWGTLQMLSISSKIAFDAFDAADAEAFNANPIQLLHEKEYVVDAPRTISVLYRVLATCRDLANDKRISTIGVPILVSASQDTII